MAQIIQASVYGIDGIRYTPPISMGFKSPSIRKVQPVRDSPGNWIATNDIPMPTRQQVYSQIIVEKDESGTSIQNIYTDRTVAQVITAINA